jgi:hypothetical protein
MILKRRHWISLVLEGFVGALALGGWALAATSHQILEIDLSKPFRTSSPWRLLATQGPSETDPLYPHDQWPGRIQLCLKKTPSSSCDTKPLAHPHWPEPTPDGFWESRFLILARVVYPNGQSNPPLFLMQTGSEISINSDQLVVTRLLAYQRGADRFVQIYAHATGHNNNQEVRLIESGPLRGGVISVEPTGDFPFAFWVEVHRLTPAYTYKRVLRYRSATRYNDGNPLGVIDSEMPNVQNRLGLWKPGSPMPLPAGCAKPRLVKMELWCS